MTPYLSGTKLPLFCGLVCAFPYCDLDGTPHPGCDHQHMTTDPVELAVIRGVATAIVSAGVPRPFVRAGEPIRTTWGCEKNKRLKARDATITDVTIGLYRDRQSMWYRPAYEYIGKSDGQVWGMFLRHIERRDGAVWTAPQYGSWSPFYFRLEWVSPNHGGIELGYDGPFADAPDRRAS